MTTINNRAAITYDNNGTTQEATSNLATATVLDPLSVSKTSLSDTYKAGDTITYVLSATNTCCCNLPNVTVTDNLGTSTSCPNSAPQTYNNDAKLYINGLFVKTITPTSASNTQVTFALPEMPRGTTASIIYSTTINNTAPLETNQSITNTATWTAGTCTGTASHTLTAASYADVSLQKTMKPDVLCDGDPISYVFTLSNYGNIPATDVVLTDTFNPAPVNITVNVNGTNIPATEYTYNNGTLTLPGSGATSTLTVPAATFTQDPETCVVTTNPGVLTITVTGELNAGVGCCTGTTTQNLICVNGQNQ